MLDRDEMREIAEKVIGMCEADEVEVVITSSDGYLTRYASNHIHQNTGETNFTITVRAVVGKRMGEASTDRLDEGSLKEVACNASELARVSPEDPELLPRLGPQDYREVEAFYYEEITPRERAEGVAQVVDPCRTIGLTAAGIFANARSSMVIANSKGLFAFYKSTSVTFSASVMGEGSSGWCERSAKTKAEIFPREIGERAIHKAEKGRNPKEIEPGKYTVVLEPAAVAGLVGYLAFGFDALAVDEGRSFLAGKLGRRVFGENVNLATDVYHPLHREAPFDAEGVPTKRVQLVQEGVVENLVYDRLTAEKHGVEPTGHGVGGRGTYGAYPRALVMGGGGDTLEEMIASTRRGIFVTRVHYQNLVDPMQLIVTGMTRDGTFWIEDGKIRFGIKNLRFNQSLLDMLNKVEMMSEAVYAFGMVVPAVKVVDFNFTSGTEF
ncbi:MAG TPA: TldD/PmbA family protein [Candidatus Latescibacteria bacterium]|nr:TldD/PmbA family protein [Candidatus Latescibacterota bacterium]